MGFLLSLSLCDFSLSNFFSSLRDVPHDALDAKIAEFHLGMVKYPEALMIIWNLALPQLTGASTNLWMSMTLPVMLSSNFLSYFSMSTTEITLFYAVLAS